MSSIVMHVFPNDTHPLSLSPGPMGDISVHASVAVHDTTLDNSNYRGARYVPRNIISNAACDTTLENSTSPSQHNHVSDTMQMTCSNEKGGDNHLITKHNLQQEIQHQQINNKSLNHSQHHTRIYTNFVRLTRVQKSTCLKSRNNHSGTCVFPFR